MNILRIQGNRQTGKSTLLAHYIKDAQKAGMKVLLTGCNLYHCNTLEEKHNFKADCTTLSLISDKDFDVLAIEENSTLEAWKYLSKYEGNMKKDFTLVITGND